MSDLTPSEKRAIEDAAVDFLMDWVDDRGMPAGFEAVAVILSCFGKNLLASIIKDSSNG